MAKKKKNQKKARVKKPGRPRTVDAPIQWHFRTSEEADAALDALADHWGCSKSEAARRSIMEIAGRHRLL